MHYFQGSRELPPPWGGASLYAAVGVMASLSSGPVLRHLAESSITTTEINL